MNKQKKRYVKPKITIIPTVSLKYNEIIALMKANDANAKQQDNNPPVTSM